MTKLLAWKPFVVDGTRKGTTLTISPLTHPDYIWPSEATVHSPCSLGHKKPVAGCVCGVYSTIDKNVAREYTHLPVVDIHSIPVLGLIQVLGKTIVEQKTLRSEGAFLWGLILPNPRRVEKELRVHMTEIFTRIRWEYSPVFYPTVTESYLDIKDTLAEYGLMNNNRINSRAWTQERKSE